MGHKEAISQLGTYVLCEPALHTQRSLEADAELKSKGELKAVSLPGPCHLCSDPEPSGNQLLPPRVDSAVEIGLEIARVYFEQIFRMSRSVARFGVKRRGCCLDCVRY